MTDMNVDSTSEEEEYFVKMTYLPDLERSQAQNKDLANEMQLAKDIIAKQELEIARLRKQVSAYREAINDATKALDTASATLHKHQGYGPY